jgi:hypothetical protein
LLSQQNNSLLKIIAVLTYPDIVVVNGLATALPINGQMTEEVSDSFPNLFAPAGQYSAVIGTVIIAIVILAVAEAYLLFFSGNKATS